MIEKEVAELRRRFRVEKSNITHVLGCYVNEKKEIISQFNQSLALMSQEESEKLLTLLRKTLSGTMGKNLLDIEFDTRQVVEDDAHKLLMTLRDSALRDSEAVEEFFRRLIQAIDMEGNYMLLLACDAYDVPYRGKDGEIDREQSSGVFQYILCSVCPVKMTKPALSYSAHENAFHNLDIDWVVSSPEAGFLFPAFDDRCTNLYNTLYYTKDIARIHPELIQAAFHTEPPMPAAAQMEIFKDILEDTLSDECSYEVVQAVNDHLRNMVEVNATNKDEPPMTIGKAEVTRVLHTNGATEEQVEAFDARYSHVFGADTELSPRNLVNTKQLEIRTPDVTIRVNPERSDLVETRIIDGARYILIRAEEGMEVDGIQVHIG